MLKQLGPPTLLVASPQLQDPNFKKAVVLLLECGDKGSMGFVINRQAGVPLQKVLPKDDYEVPGDVPVWFGGPVETETGIILHNQVEEETDEPVDGSNVILSSNEHTLASLLNYAKSAQFEESKAPMGSHPAAAWKHPYRFLVGYSGWGPGQLEEELRMGAWIDVPASEELMFNVDYPDLWQKSLESVGIDPSSLAPAESSYLN